MKAWVYVEGQSDVLALNALWRTWVARLRDEGHGIAIIALDDKARYFKKVGPRTAEKLVASSNDVVVGLPDLYPNRPFNGSAYEHANLEALQRVQKALVEEALRKRSDVPAGSLPTCLARFHPSALKHDLEMLLLAATHELRSALGTQDRLGNWCLPVENQNQDHPPKRVIEELFRTKSKDKRAYRDTRDAPGVLGRVNDVRTLLYTDSNQLNCPVFKSLLDWLGERFGVSPYAPGTM